MTLQKIFTYLFGSFHISIFLQKISVFKISLQYKAHKFKNPMSENFFLGSLVILFLTILFLLLNYYFMTFDDFLNTGF